eukprot:484301-Pelagomonas_calceolata.AAC.4
MNLSVQISNEQLVWHSCKKLVPLSEACPRGAILRARSRPDPSERAHGSECVHLKHLRNERGLGSAACCHNLSLNMFSMIQQGLEWMHTCPGLKLG